MQTSGIVQLHYYFEDEHHVLLLLEYANGGSLFSLLRLGAATSRTSSAARICGIAKLCYT